MKELCLIATCLGLTVCRTDGATNAVSVATNATVAAPAVAMPGAKSERPPTKRLTPEERQALQAKAKAERAAREKAEAEKLGITVEELRKRRVEERRVQREKIDRARAEKEGIPYEEYVQKRQARRDEAVAKRLGVTVEELRQMTPEQKKAKYEEMRAQRQAERKARLEKKESK